MANVRASVYLLLLLVNYQLVAGKPTFGSSFWCSLLQCEDDDDDSGDDEDDYSFFDIFDACAFCSSSKDTKEATTTPVPGKQPLNIMINPAEGLNVSLSGNSMGSFILNLLPWGPPATAAPAAAAPATTAAPAAAAAAATTAAGSTAATTAAATTAAAK